MKIYSREQCNDWTPLKKEILRGAIFMYPTDTIYGLGCNALDQKAVAKLRSIKHRDVSPFSVIAPSQGWISENCLVSPSAGPWLSKLPGPYTLILPLNSNHGLAPNVTNKTIGVRIPDHWLTPLLQSTDVPIVTTSVNLSGQPPMHSKEELSKEIASQVDFLIDEGEKKNAPSTLVNLVGKDPVIIQRR